MVGVGVYGAGEGADLKEEDLEELLKEEEQSRDGSEVKKEST
jgi:hypothetical protein